MDFLLCQLYEIRKTPQNQLYFIKNPYICQIQHYPLQPFNIFCHEEIHTNTPPDNINISGPSPMENRTGKKVNRLLQPLRGGRR